MIFVVSGYRRSGTSMMMRALHEGGIAAVYNPSLDDTANPKGDEYTANPSGLFEVGTLYYLNAKFLREIPDESVIKILFDGVAGLPLGRYKIIFMIRDPKEIEASVKRADKHMVDEGLCLVSTTADWPAPFNCFRPYKQEDIDHVLGICEARSDFDLIKVNFSDLIKHPKHELETLRLLGVPIDVEKAAATVNPELYRFKNELPASQKDCS